MTMDLGIPKQMLFVLKWALPVLQDGKTVTYFHLYKTALKSILTKSTVTMKTGHLAHTQRNTIVDILKMSLSHAAQVRFRLLITLLLYQHLCSL